MNTSFLNSATVFGLQNCLSVTWWKPGPLSCWIIIIQDRGIPMLLTVSAINLKISYSIFQKKPLYYKNIKFEKQSVLMLGTTRSWVYLDNSNFQLLSLHSSTGETFLLGLPLPTVPPIAEPHLFYCYCELCITNKAGTNRSMKILHSKLCHHDLNVHQASELPFKSSVEGCPMHTQTCKK